MHSLDILLVALAVTPTTTGAVLNHQRIQPVRKSTDIVLAYHPSPATDLLSPEEVRDSAAAFAIKFSTPTTEELAPVHIVPASPHGLLPEWNAPNQDLVPGAGIWPATAAFVQSSPRVTDSPFRPAEPVPPPRPEISTFYVTITNAPVTRTILDTATFTRTITLPPLPPLAPPTVRPKAIWNTPTHFANLDCFGIIKYGFGRSNIKVVHGIPASASASTRGSADNVSAIEIFYPKGSINPGNSPQGGADFYANPLPALKKAQNVTFGYSVFLPVDFEPVRGGKLPGLYGGKTGCSGGDAAVDCFSTRLMWRTNNDGELYLYAPKDKQADQVCNTPPQSFCEADYGLSIGRGSFKFKPGQWTHVSQTVVLNTPGRQDGHFALDVDGKRVMDLQGVYYRQTATPKGEDEDIGVQSVSTSGGGLNAASANGGKAPGQETGTPNPNVESPPESGEGGGLLGHIVVSPPTNSGSAHAPMWHAPGRLPVLLAPNPRRRHQRQRRHDHVRARPASELFPNAALRPPSLIHPDTEIYALTVTKALQPATITVHSRVVETQVAIITAQPTPSVINLATKHKVPGFSGIFFSTFFGGHEQKFATPKDQKMWFKDFELVVNE